MRTHEAGYIVQLHSKGKCSYPIILNTMRTVSKMSIHCTNNTIHVHLMASNYNTGKAVQTSHLFPSVSTIHVFLQEKMENYLPVFVTSFNNTHS